MWNVELPTPVPVMPELADDLERVAKQNPHPMVPAIEDVQVLLPRVSRERDGIRRSRENRSLGDEDFLDERAVLLEHLHAVVRAVADIHQPIVGNRHRVRRAELLGGRRIRLVRTDVRILRAVAVRAPHSFEGAGVGVEHDDAPVPVAVGDVHLIGRRVQLHVGRPVHVLGVVVPSTLTLMADLQHELAQPGELENLRILRAIAGGPNEVLLINVDAVLALGPFIAGALAAP